MPGPLGRVGPAGETGNIIGQNPERKKGELHAISCHRKRP
jgi:hypothetical protein